MKIEDVIKELKKYPQEMELYVEGLPQDGSPAYEIIGVQYSYTTRLIDKRWIRVQIITLYT